MKKALLFAGAVATAAILTGCRSAYVNNYGFGSTMPGVIYSDTTRGSFILPKAESMKDVEVLGPVRGTSSMTNILLITAFGDAGIEEAKRNALMAYPEADDILNIEVDTKHDSILEVFNTSTTILRGIAVKYKKQAVTSSVDRP